MKTFSGLPAKKYILDPVHGPIYLTPIELQVISTPIFQRLRDITQLGMASMVYPGAIHNRFQHSLGAMQVMDRLLSTLKQDNLISGDDVDYIIQNMRLTALLHDCGHLPFSHIFENHYPKDQNHEFMGKIIIERSQIKDILELGGFIAEEISALVMGKPSFKSSYGNQYISLLPLISSDADADRMDYLLRDAYFTGIPYGKIDIDRIYNSITLDQNRICYYEKAQDALEDFLFSRFQMYKTVYLHKSVIQYDLVLLKIYAIFEKYSDLVSFQLPSIDLFEAGWIDWEFPKLTESLFFNDIRRLIHHPIVDHQDQYVLYKFLNNIQTRTPIKLAFRYDNLAEREKKEYCEREQKCFEELQKEPEIINHWSFLHHDPKKPLSIIHQINSEIDDDQDPNQIIIKTLDGKHVSLYHRSNSLIKDNAQHHRVLICYYHFDSNARDKIAEISKKYFPPVNNQHN